MSEDHQEAIRLIGQRNPKEGPAAAQLYREARDLFTGASTVENVKYIRRKTDQDGVKTAVVIHADTGQFVQLSLRPSESQLVQLTVGKMSLMTVVDPVRSTYSIKLWD